MITGAIRQNATDSDVFLVKTDSNGNMLWNRTIGGPTLNEGSFYVIPTIDNGYAIMAVSLNASTSKDSFWLIKTDLNGNIQWNNTYTATSGARGS